MKLRYKILLGIGGVLTIGIATLMTVTAYDSPCPTATPADAGSDSIRALVPRCYGVQNIRVERIAKPVPAEGQVLVRIRASSINPAEWYGINGQPYLVRLAGGIGKPNDTRAGYDAAGVVEAVGPKVTRFKPGDEVFGGVPGALGEYGIAREQGGIVLKPANLSFEEAAGMPIAAITALQGLRDNGHIAAGQKVLINGASGGVGTYAVQIAKAFGAEVTGVCSTRNVEMVKSLGADYVIDYTNTDFTQGNVKYDLILDNVGNHGYHGARGCHHAQWLHRVGGRPEDQPLAGADHARDRRATHRGDVHRPAPAVLHRARHEGRHAGARGLRRAGQAAHGHRPALSARGDQRSAGIPGQPARAGEGHCHHQLKHSQRWWRPAAARRIATRGWRPTAITSRSWADSSRCTRQDPRHRARSKPPRSPRATSLRRTCRWALALVMHLYPLCALRCVPLPWFSPAHRRRAHLLRTIDGRRLVLANAGSERTGGMSAPVKVTRVDDAIQLDGTFEYVSLAHVADLVLFAAPLTDTRSVFCVADLRAPGVLIGEPRFSGSMTLSDTCSLTFKAHRLPADRSIEIASQGTLDCMTQYQRSWFQLLLAEAYLARIQAPQRLHGLPHPVEEIASLNELACLRELRAPSAGPPLTTQLDRIPGQGHRRDQAAHLVAGAVHGGITERTR